MIWPEDAGGVLGLKVVVIRRIVSNISYFYQPHFGYSANECIGLIVKQQPIDIVGDS